jgi:hypothetical protein
MDRGGRCKMVRICVRLNGVRWRYERRVSIPVFHLRKPAQRAVRASRTVEVGGCGGRVRGRAMAAPLERDSSAVRSRSLFSNRARETRALSSLGCGTSEVSSCPPGFITNEGPHATVTDLSDHFDDIDEETSEFVDAFEELLRERFDLDATVTQVNNSPPQDYLEVHISFDSVVDELEDEIGTEVRPIGNQRLRISKN